MSSGPARGNHFSCSLTVVLLARVHDHGGDEAVAELLRRAGSTRTAEELSDLSNWISYDEGIALLRAGAEVTHHPQFAVAVGQDAVGRLKGSSVATLLRSLGSPEEVFRQITAATAKFSTVARLEAGECGPGFAHVTAKAVEGFPRAREHCQWTSGMLSQPTILFGLPAATVEHTQCESYGAPACEYRITWPVQAAGAGEPSAEPEVEQLRAQLQAMKERLHSMFATAADLISAGKVQDVLGRIADRAAFEVRAPRYLLAVRIDPDGDLQCHQRGLRAGEIEHCKRRLASGEPVPDSWLVAPVRTERRDYGWLLAIHDDGARVLDEEHELLEVYARYAGGALDSATALLEAERRYAQSNALLELARALPGAGTSTEIARRLADSVSVVVDCDRVGVYLWDPINRVLERRAVTQSADGETLQLAGVSRWTPQAGGILERLIRDPDSTPILVSPVDDGALAAMFASLGFVATLLVPLAAGNRFLGMLSVSVVRGQERLQPTADLLDRLSGVAAQASTALENGQLVDQITHQATHDQLTGLANRAAFTRELEKTISDASAPGRRVTLVYLDLDNFKPINDEHGHETGDRLLAAVAGRLRACVRSDDVVARLGGDEFAVLVGGASRSEADAVVKRMAAVLDGPVGIGGLEVRLGVSVGRAIYPDDASDADGLLRVADAAMFAAKRLRQGPSTRLAA